MKEINPLNFWKYAYSDFLDNRNRAALGEFIVAKALGIKESPYSSWESYDMETADGTKIEVKTSGYIQTWNEEKHSVPSYGIAKKQGWDENSNDFDGVVTRQADVYVFCLHHEVCKPKEANPLNLGNWTFYVASTKLIEKELKDQKTVRISTLTNVLGCKAVEYVDLKRMIKLAGEEN
ncbi:MAG: hypothetical protein AAFQ94_18215 [Bacteroidota bacterium]